MMGVDEDERRSSCHLLLGSSLLGSGLLGLLGSGLLGSRLLGSGLLGGLLGSRLLSGLLGSGLLGGLLGSGLLGLGLLGGGLLLLLLDGELEASGSLLASGTSGNDLLGLGHLLECPPAGQSSLGGVDLVVGADVLEDGLTAGAVPLLEGLDGGGDHVGEGRVGGGDLRLGGLLDLRGSGGGSHVVDVGCLSSGKKQINCPTVGGYIRARREPNRERDRLPREFSSGTLFSDYLCFLFDFKHKKCYEIKIFLIFF